MRRRSLALVAALFAVGVAVALAIWFAGDGPAAPQASGPPKRVITIGPNVTETVFALGAGERVVAVTDFCTYPPEARRRPRIGSLFHPNLERIIALEPDLIVMQSPMEKVTELCEKRGIRHVALRMNTLEAIRTGIVTAGGMLGCEGRAAQLVAEIDAELDQVRSTLAGRPRVKLFLCTGRAPGALSGLGTAGPGSFLAELVEIAGGENIFADAITAYPQVSKEALVRRAPAVIVELRPGAGLDEDALAELVAEWSALPPVPAVREGRVHVLTVEFLLIPGPRIAETVRRLAGILYPDAFQEQPIPESQ